MKLTVRGAAPVAGVAVKAAVGGPGEDPGLRTNMFVGTQVPGVTRFLAADVKATRPSSEILAWVLEPFPSTPVEDTLARVRVSEFRSYTKTS
jgi:hypothetical protein